MQKVLRDSIAGLRENEQVVLSLYYQKMLQMKEIAKVLGVSEPRVSQIHSNAIRKLRAAMTAIYMIHNEEEYAVYKGFYDLTSAMLTQTRNLDVIGNNMSNTATTGYKADRYADTTFDEVMRSRVGEQAESPAGIGYNDELYHSAR